MNWAAKYQSKRNRYWPEVEAYFSALPVSLLPQGELLTNNLATCYSDTGQFRDILCREHDHPLLYLHLWLLEDWHIPATPQRAALEKHLFLAMLFNFAAVYTQETILDEGSNFDHQHYLLAQTLSQQATFHLAQLFPGIAPFWRYHRTFWTEYTEETLMTANRRPSGTETLAAKLAYTKIPIAGIVEFTEQGGLVDQLCNLMDRINFVHQTLRDIATLRRDLNQRRFTYPLLQAMTEAGLDPRQPLVPEQLFGALVLTGTIEQIGHRCLSQLEECHSISEACRLPTFGIYLSTIGDRVRQVMDIFDLKTKARVSQEPGVKRPFFTPFIDTLPKVIEMAEGFLLSDPTFRESWEVQRRGAFGEAVLTAKAFPSGLIVEVLGRHGHDVGESINFIFDTLQETGFRYYDTPHMPPDADDLGLLLRLYPFTGRPAAHRQVLQTPLGWLKRNFSDSGEFPVWFTKQDSADELTYCRLSLWGQSCITVEANLLLGLMAFDFEGYHDLIEQSSRMLLERLNSQGLGAARHYVALYSLWTGLEFITKIAGSPLGATLQSPLEKGTQILTEKLSIEAGRPSLTPQDAAFLTLACLSEGSPISSRERFKPRWITILCKNQRYDGSWSSEPLFCTPTRGELATWYSSRSVTTAYCYHALKTYLAATDNNH